MCVSISNLRAKADFRTIISGRARERRVCSRACRVRGRALSRARVARYRHILYARRTSSEFVQRKCRYSPSKSRFRSSGSHHRIPRRFSQRVRSERPRACARSPRSCPVIKDVGTRLVALFIVSCKSTSDSPRCVSLPSAISAREMMNLTCRTWELRRIKFAFCVVTGDERRRDFTLFLVAPCLLARARRKLSF